MNCENIVIDTCIECRLLWLDPGELRQVIDAPGRDRGPGSAHQMDDLNDSWLAKQLKL